MEDIFSFGFIITFAFITYILNSIPMYLLGKKANLENAFWGFIPILNTLLLFDIIGERRLSIILLFIPIVNILFSIYWIYKLFVVFNTPAILYSILYLFIPFASIIILYYMAFSSRIRYVGNQ